MKDFRIRVIFRVVMLGASVALFIFMLSRSNMIFAAGLNFLLIVFQLIELFKFTSQTNRKLTRFLESVRYSDFASGFAADNKLGKSFKELNESFNEVLEAFRKARSEKEENWQYLNTVVQQVRTGIISFDTDGYFELMNANAKKFVGFSNLKNISELEKKNPKLYAALMDVQSGKSVLYKTNEFLLTLQATELRIRGNTVKLITMQNIQTELQQQEIESWQNLTRVLRHEIMNSITPISSLTSTLREILDHELIKKENDYEMTADVADDLREGLGTIESRSKGLIKFIDAYREYTSLPQPKIKTVLLKELIDKTSQFMKTQLKKSTIEFSSSCSSDYLTVQADEEMIEQVLINLVKNSMESLSQNGSSGKIELSGKYDGQNVLIEIADNGPGIIPEAINRIFVPFFTTKRTGSGIGLALSRQIMQMHNGSLTVESEPEVKTVFTLKF